MSIDPKPLEERIHAFLSTVFSVEPERISVSVTMDAVDAEVPEGHQRVILGLALDGRSPPPSWRAAVEEVLGVASRCAATLGHGPITIRGGLLGDGAGDPPPASSATTYKTIRFPAVLALPFPEAPRAVSALHGFPDGVGLGEATSEAHRDAAHEVMRSVIVEIEAKIFPNGSSRLRIVDHGAEPPNSCPAKPSST